MFRLQDTIILGDACYRHSVVTISRVPQALFGRGRRESIAAFPALSRRRDSGGKQCEFITYVYIYLLYIYFCRYFVSMYFT